MRYTLLARTIHGARRAPALRPQSGLRDGAGIERRAWGVAGGSEFRTLETGVPPDVRLRGERRGHKPAATSRAPGLDERPAGMSRCHRMDEREEKRELLVAVGFVIGSVDVQNDQRGVRRQLVYVGLLEVVDQRLDGASVDRLERCAVTVTVTVTVTAHGHGPRSLGNRLLFRAADQLG